MDKKIRIDWVIKIVSLIFIAGIAYATLITSDMSLKTDIGVIKCELTSEQLKTQTLEKQFISISKDMEYLKIGIDEIKKNTKK